MPHFEIFVSFWTLTNLFAFVVVAAAATAVAVDTNDDAPRQPVANPARVATANCSPYWYCRVDSDATSKG